MYTVNQQATFNALVEIGGDKGWILLDELKESMEEFDDGAVDALVKGGFLQAEKDKKKRLHLAVSGVLLDPPTHGVPIKDVDLSKLKKSKAKS
jgi:hypothetical protein